jgi:hypothetical protein
MASRMTEENNLDILGYVAAGLGIAVIIFAFTQAGTFSAFVEAVQAGSQLVLVGIAAVVGGGAVIAYFKE